jgi:hypothetical protein
MKSVPRKKFSQNEPSPRILELQKKIHDRNYQDSAIQRIAFVMSRQLVENIPAGRIL